MAAEPTSSVQLPWRVALGVASLLLALIAAWAAGGDEPAGAAKLKTIGKTKSTPPPSCPGKGGRECVAVGSVTGFQSKADGENGIFKIHDRGHVVAWSAELSRPNADEREFFGAFYRQQKFGTTPVARLGIIRREDGERYVLKKQSPAVKLGSFLGETPVITLDKPLRVRKGDIAAITVPTWLPNFAVELSPGNVWRASRSPEKCAGDRDIQEGRPHEKVDDVRRYGCRYTTARLVYWAYFVPADGKDGGGGGGKDGGGGGGGGGGNDGGGGGGR